MLNINNKLKSDRFIINSGMNYTPFGLIRTVQEAYCYLYRCINPDRGPFSIRFKGTGMQPFLPSLTTIKAYAFCVDHFKKDNTPLGIYEATEGYDDYRSMNCEIRINPNLTVDAHYGTGDMKMRDALRSPDSKHLNSPEPLFPSPLWCVGLDFKPLRWAIEYLCKYDIIGPVVELTKFSKKVGVKKDYIVCWEVRNF